MGYLSILTCPRGVFSLRRSACVVLGDSKHRVMLVVCATGYMPSAAKYAGGWRWGRGFCVECPGIINAGYCMLLLRQRSAGSVYSRRGGSQPRGRVAKHGPAVDVLSVRDQKRAMICQDRTNSLEIGADSSRNRSRASCDCGRYRRTPEFRERIVGSLKFFPAGIFTASRTTHAIAIALGSGDWLVSNQLCELAGILRSGEVSLRQG